MGASHESDAGILAFQMHSHFKVTEEPMLIMSGGLAVIVSVGKGTD